MEEQWKDIIGYEGLYQISNLGRVKSLKYGKERILKPYENQDGYLEVNLYNDDKKRNHIKIHRLVANAFIPNKDISKTEINHKDENKGNNIWTNLEWTDHITNIQYGTRTERSSVNRINNANISKQVAQYSLDGNFIRSFPSTKEIQRQLGFANQYIGQCCLGKRKQAYNYIWKYTEENNEEPIQIQ